MNGSNNEAEIEVEFFTVNEAARYVGMSDTLIRKSTKLGLLRTVRVEKSMLRQKAGRSAPYVNAISREDLDNFREHPAFKKSKKKRDICRGLH